MKRTKLEFELEGEIWYVSELECVDIHATLKCDSEKIAPGRLKYVDLHGL